MYQLSTYNDLKMAETLTAESTTLERATRGLNRVREEIAKVIVGQTPVIDGVLICLIAGGHVLLEGVPGLGKTTLLRTLSHVMDLRYSRIQFTPDLMPGDIVGSMVMENDEHGHKTLRFQPGPVFANLVLADEINRATPKTQSALLEAMQERTVTSGTSTYSLEAPFLVMATQNPIESDGTYPLPEAQIDRFMLKVLVDYPTATEEFVIVQRMISGLEEISEVLGAGQLRTLQRTMRSVFVDPAIIDYAVRVSTATRNPAGAGLPEIDRYITYGVSPRASIYLVTAAQALALVRGRQYVLPDDVRTIAPDVLRHRLVLSYEALSDQVNAEYVVGAVLRSVPIPDVVLRNVTT